MDALLAVGVGVAVTILGGVLLHRWNKSEKQAIDITKLESKLENETNERKLEIRRLEIQINAHQQVIELLRKRYHFVRTQLNKCLWKLGIKAEDDGDEDA